MASSEPKQYGLILPNKVKNTPTPATRKLNPLVDSDDELEKDDQSPLNWVEASLKKSAGNSGQQSLQKRLLREALQEDASIFQYDEVYDEMKAANTTQTTANKNKANLKPKYIPNILKQAEKRKLESERRMERKVHKEREAEGDEFADKESFVTSSYLKKMEELKQAEREAKMEELMEEKVDVVKHKNFSVFYNHLFQQRIGAIKEEPKSDDDDDNNDDDDDETAGGNTQEKKKDEAGKRPKNYRTQRDLSESPERQHGEPKTKKRRSIDIKHHHSSSSDSEKEEGGKGETYRDRREKYRALEERKRDNERSEKFEQALQRYFIRKAERDAE
ncbi:hypothetical protein Pmani_028922 [Petrolisthes manimaculis]|uniref:Nuclear speckle splicing regulatory protein 1 N-terminal domain-containing protein n=1 Tax=Petrolisthes manimaculis TaxID=1843537 RepID=A0AAE1TUE1_9EUCA|nr:hypothetical protein Pmani_028922 [Petrolisthes manimaculis]